MKKITKKFNASVLVVDDYELNLDLVRSFLELMGCVVTTASSGTQALEILQTCTFDLILLDIQMPGMDGTQAAEEMRKILRKKTPILALTAHALAGDQEKFLRAGMDGYISKPVSGHDLEKALTNYLTSRNL